MFDESFHRVYEDVSELLLAGLQVRQYGGLRVSRLDFLKISCSRYMGGCQNYGAFLGTLNIRCRIVIGTPKGTIILTTTHM